MSKYHPVEVIHFITQNDLSIYKKIGSKAPLHKFNAAKKLQTNKKGVVFVSESKTDLIQGKGFVVTSYETLHEKCEQLTHWTPNTFRGGTYYDFKNRIIKGHTRDNLKQISAIGFDIDTKNVDLYALFLGCDQLGLPRPNVLLETPRGYQGFFVLDTPFYISNKQNFKSLAVAERVADNMLHALKKYAPIDLNCAPFGFYRIPNSKNIRFFDANPASTASLITWSKQYEKETKNDFQVVHNRDTNKVDYTKSAWYRALINARHIQPGHYGSSRNNTLFTLAVANYVSGVDYAAAFDELDVFNSNLNNPISKSEFERTLKSAYSGKYSGVKRLYAESLLDNWTSGDVRFQGGNGWYKFAKPREERERSHYHERENDIIAYLNKHTSPVNPFIEGSIRTMAGTFGMAVSTFKEVLKRSKQLIKRTVGRGRYAVSMLATRSMLIQNVLLKRQEKKQMFQMAVVQGNPVDMYIPRLEELVGLEEFDIEHRSGASPPIRNTG